MIFEMFYYTFRIALMKYHWDALVLEEEKSHFSEILFVTVLNRIVHISLNLNLQVLIS